MAAWPDDEDEDEVRRARAAYQREHDGIPDGLLPYPVRSGSPGPGLLEDPDETARTARATRKHRKVRDT